MGCLIARFLGFFLLSFAAAPSNLPSTSDYEVALGVTVLDDDGKVAGNLTAADFRIREDDQEQRINSVTPAAEFPRTVALLLDVSSSRRGQSPGAERGAAMAFLRGAVREKDTGMVVAFAGSADLFADLTSDRDELQRAVARALGPEPRGSSAFLDAIQAVCERRLYGTRGSKSIVVVTDGVDTGSDVTPEQVVACAQHNQISIYVVRLPKGELRTSGSESRKASRVLRMLVDETGGLQVQVKKASEFDQAFMRIGAALDSQYVLKYTPTNTARDGSYRKVKVESRRKGIKILTRKGYYAPGG
ncbi:MAG: VWA domain-containing protein [Candidatus Acidiferrales bacterium]